MDELQFSHWKRWRFVANVSVRKDNYVAQHFNHVLTACKNDINIFTYIIRIPTYDDKIVGKGEEIQNKRYNHQHYFCSVCILLACILILNSQNSSVNI